MTEDTYIGTKEIQRKLNVAYATVLAMVKTGKIPAIKVGTGYRRIHYRILRSDFEKFLAESRTDVK